MEWIMLALAALLAWRVARPYTKKFPNDRVKRIAVRLLALIAVVVITLLGTVLLNKVPGVHSLLDDHWRGDSGTIGAIIVLAVCLFGALFWRTLKGMVKGATSGGRSSA